MRYELKITLPIYKIVYSIAFMVIIVLVSPINSFSGIITAVEPNVALLAGVFMADNYYKEYVGERVAVFYRYPIRKKYISMLVRTLLSWLYLLILVAVFYWGFVWWYRPSNFSQIPIWKMYADTLAACAASMFFAGVFSFTITNVIQKIGIGIGVISKFSQRCLKEKNITFNTSKELRDGAFIRLEVVPIRGVIAWAEIQYEDMPSIVQDNYAVPISDSDK